MLMLMFSVVCCLCAGSLYIFSALQPALSAACSAYSAEDIDLVYSFGQAGVGLGFLPGLVGVLLGPFWVPLYGALCLSMGSFGFSLSVQRCASPLVLSTSYLALQHGSTALYQSALFPSLAAASKSNAGKISGLLSASLGLSGALWNSVYTFTGWGLTSFVTTSGLLWTAVALTQAFLLYRRRPSAQLNANESSRELLQFPSDSIPREAAFLNGNSDKATVKPPHPLSSALFWTVFFQFALTNCVGSGLFIANLKLLSGNLGLHTSADRSLSVTLVSLANTAGRLLAGLFLDLSRSYVSARRLMLLSAGLMCFCCVSISLSETFPIQHPLLLLAAAGFAYGFNWTLLPAHMSLSFGQKHMALGFGLPVLLMSVGVRWISQHAGAEVDENAGPTGVCAGSAAFCFGDTAWMGAALTTCSLILGLGDWALLREDSYLPTTAQRDNVPI